MSEAETPSARIVRDANRPFEANTAGGRRFSLRQMNVLDRLRLFKAVGSELAQNEAYLGIAYLACAVSAIDDVPIPSPINEAQIETMVGRLGDDGIAAVADAFAAAEATRSNEQTASKNRGN